MVYITTDENIYEEREGERGRERERTDGKFPNPKS